MADPCPDCGKPKHNPQTGFCWKSTSRNPRSGFHCNHCCKIGDSNDTPRSTSSHDA